MTATATLVQPQGPEDGAWDTRMMGLQAAWEIESIAATLLRTTAWSTEVDARDLFKRGLLLRLVDLAGVTIDALDPDTEASRDGALKKLTGGPIFQPK